MFRHPIRLGILALCLPLLLSGCFDTEKKSPKDAPGSGGRAGNPDGGTGGTSPDDGNGGSGATGGAGGQGDAGGPGGDGGAGGQGGSAGGGDGGSGGWVEHEVEPLLERELRSMAIDDTHIYFAAANQVFRIGKDGRGEKNLLPPATPTEGWVNVIRVDGGFVFAAHSSGVARVPVAGGSIKELVNDHPDHFTADGMVVDASHVYILGGMTDPMDSLAVVPYIGRVSRDGGKMQQLSSRSTNHLALHGNWLSFDYVETGTGNREVRSVPRSGGTETVLLDEMWEHPISTKTHLYFVSIDPAPDAAAFHALYRLALEPGATPERITGVETPGPLALSPDGKVLYFSERGHQIRFVPADATDAPSRLLTNEAGYLVGFGVDDEFVYFAMPSDGIFRVPR